MTGPQHYCVAEARVEDPSLRPPDARATRVFFLLGVSSRR
jgi:hypothetical protein